MGGKRTPLLFNSFRSNLAKQAASFCFTQLEGYNFRIVNSLIRLLGVSLSWVACKLYNLPNYYGVVVEGIYSSQAQILKSLAAGFHFTDTSHILPKYLLRPQIAEALRGGRGVQLQQSLRIRRLIKRNYKV